MMKTIKALDRLKAGRGTEEGFTLIELLIVMSVMLILMTLAVPQMLKLTKQAHETSAIQSVRTIGQAQLQYNSAYPANGFACSLAVLGGDPKSGAPTAQSLAACFAGPCQRAEGRVYVCHHQLHQGDGEQSGHGYGVRDYRGAEFDWPDGRSRLLLG